MILSRQQIARFTRDGFLMLENVLSPEQLGALQKQFAQWTHESRKHDAPFGKTVDHRPRFDVEPEHCAEQQHSGELLRPSKTNPTRGTKFCIIRAWK